MSKLDVAKHAAISQLSYFKLAVLGGRKRKDRRLDRERASDARTLEPDAGLGAAMAERSRCALPLQSCATLASLAALMTDDRGLDGCLPFGRACTLE